MSSATDRPDHSRAILDCALANLQEHPECVDKDVEVGCEVLTRARDGRWVTVAYVTIDGAAYAVEVTRVTR